MKEFAVTGIRYQMESHLSADERERAAERLVKELKVGAKVLLVAEPDNPVDGNAVAVYINYNQMVGYIAREQCTEVHDYLDMNGQGEAVVCGNDGHITFFVEVAGASFDIYESIRNRPRKLPESPIDSTVLMPISKKENSLEAIIYKFLSKPICKENSHDLLEMASRYVPVACISICHADDYWRRATQNKIRELYLKADELGFTKEEKESLHELKDELRNHVRDMHRVHEDSLQRLFVDQLNYLRNDESTFGCLLKKYQGFYLKSTFEEADPKLIAAEYVRLNKWFSDMPVAEMRNPKNLGLMAMKLNYMGVSRRELYDVFSVLLLLEKLEARLAEKKVIKKSAREITPAGFALLVTKPEKAEAVITRLHELIDSQCRPKAIVMPIRAAMDAGAIRKPTWNEFCAEFGSEKLKSSTSLNDYTNDMYIYPGADFITQKDEFIKIISM